MLKNWYLSSRAAIMAGVSAFGITVLVMKLFHLPHEVALAPGMILRTWLNALGADQPAETVVFFTLAAWCLFFDGFFLIVRKPWRRRTTA